LLYFAQHRIDLLDLVNVARSSRREHSALLLQGASLALLFFLFYGATINGLVRDWLENSTYSYGFLIPFIAAYLVWERWEGIKSTPIRATIRGIFPLALAVLLGLIGSVVGDTFTARVSMILALGSMIYLLLGRNLLRKVLFPVCYLALMIPLPFFLTKEIAYHLRFFDASLAETALKVLGIPVYREAYFLHLPNITLEVADICAGLASIFALFALGTFYVYFLPLATRIKAVLLLSTFPIAVFANLVRIIIVSALAYVIGPVTLEMLFHRFSGTVTFLLALMLLVLLGELLRKKWPQPLSRTASLERSEIDFHINGTVGDWKPFIMGAGTFACALSIAMLLDGGRVFALPRSGFQTLPGSLGPFTVARLNWDDPYSDPKADSSLSRIYVAPAKAPVEVFLGYKGSQNAGDRLLSPKLIPGEHWNFEWVKPARVDFTNGPKIGANWMLARKGKAARLVLYWYQFNERMIAGELDYRIELVKRLVFDRRSDGAVVRLATPVADSEPIEQAQERLTTFAAVFYPELVKVLPQ
jgi:EpsI family protein